MKSKKVLMILLSLAIMVTFMPTFAFAETATGEFNAEHVWDTDVTHEKEIVAPTCTSAGIVEVNCVRDGEICNATHVQAKALLGHDYVDKRFDSAADYAAALLNAGVFTDKAVAAEWVATYGANVCYGYAKVCSKCGALQVTSAGTNHLYGLTATEHKEPAKTKNCAASFTCDICGKEKATNSTHNATTAEDYHSLTGTHVTPKTLTGEKYCTANVDVTYTYTQNYQTRSNTFPLEVWEEVTTYTCDECKAVVGKTSNLDYDLSDADRRALPGSPSPSTIRDAVKKLENHLNHNMVEKVVRAATCKAAGEKTSVCADCGYQGVTTNIAQVAHDYSVDVSVPATVSSAAYTAKACSFCGAVDSDSYTYTGQPLSSKSAYTIELLRAKSCDEAGIVKVSRTVENASTLNRVDYLTYDRSTSKYVWFGTSTQASVYSTDKDYFKGFNGELADSDAIEIPDIKPVGHKWAKAAKVADATCLIAEQEAMTCTVCGNIKHPTTKVGKALGHEVEEIVVPSTCGTAGYTYKVCTRCNQFLDKYGKTKAENTGVTTDKYDEAQKYNETAPIVKLGTECSFAWKVTKPATETEDGEKALVCSVCGTVKDGSQTVIPADVATAEKKAAVEAATPAIEAAAEVISNDKVYTASSVEAVKEAKDMLNSAIASGTAADVKAMTENLQKVTAAAVEKAENTMTASGKTVKASAKKTKTFAKTKAFSVKSAKGKVTFKKASGDKKIVVSSAGKVTVKKGLKKGKTYKVKVNVSAAGNGDYLAASKVVTLKVKVGK